MKFPLCPSQPLFQIERDPGFDPLAQRAFPDDRDSPAGLEQAVPVASVPLRVGIELGSPELRAGGRDGRVRAPGMAVPEAAVDKAHGSELTKDEIGSAGEFPVVQTVSQTACVKGPAQGEFGPRVSSADSRHHAGARGLIHYVRHRWSLRVWEASRQKRTSRQFVNMTKLSGNTDCHFGQGKSVDWVLRSAGLDNVDRRFRLPPVSKICVVRRGRGDRA